MSSTSFVRKRGQPPVMSAQDRAQLSAMTDAAADEGARLDSDNPPLSDAALRRMVIAREVRRIREAAGLSQPQFAERYRLGLSRLRDWEQGRFAPDFAAMAFLQLIADHPDIASELVLKVEKVQTSA